MAYRERRGRVVSLPGGELVLLIGWEGACEIVVAGRGSGAVRRACDTLARALRQSAPRREELMVRFWANGGREGAHARRRRLDAPEWGAIARNYPPAVRQGLERLVRGRRPGRGTVLLWHGAPGTGKTHALRALARAWRAGARCTTSPIPTAS
jgi:hypothetical protein